MEQKREVSGFIQPWKCKSETEPLGVEFVEGWWPGIGCPGALTTGKVQVNYKRLAGFYWAADYIKPDYFFFPQLRKPSALSCPCEAKDTKGNAAASSSP